MDSIKYRSIFTDNDLAYIAIYLMSALSIHLQSSANDTAEH
jgi:hypothetical protein